MTAKNVVLGGGDDVFRKDSCGEAIGCGCWGLLPLRGT